MAGKGKGGNTVAAVWEIAAPVAEQLGLSIWDIRFQKEGVSWYLRIYIDKEGGVGITDCENFSRAVDGPLDDADPIEQSYYLEVSSPGVERQLTRDEHFKKYIGSPVMVRLIRYCVARTCEFSHVQEYAPSFTEPCALSHTKFFRHLP